MEKNCIDELIEKLTYDDRHEQNWHGYVGAAYVRDDGSISIMRSWADPSAGTNEERLILRPGKKGKGVRVTGFNDRGDDIDFTSPADWSMKDLVERMLKADGKSIEALVDAIRGKQVYEGVIYYSF